ncbi:MAG: flippase-like domain-containing protein [Oscillospiraceae bacterium]|nr:flippase-like domain-containing protein [Oscillospiraceae bacterium]
MIFNIFIILLSAAFLVYFGISENGLLDLVKNAMEFNKMWLFVALFFHLLNIFIDACLIHRFTCSTGKQYPFKNAFKTSMVGQFFGAITPCASGGQPMQIYSMRKQGIDTGHSTSALVQKFLVYQNSITAYGAASILFKKKIFLSHVPPAAHWLSLLGFVSQSLVIILLFLFSFNRPITHKIIKVVFNWLAKLKLIKNVDEKSAKVETQLNYFHDNNAKFYKSKKLVLAVYALTFFQLTCMFVVPYFIYRSFNLYGAKISDMVAAQSFVTMASAFVPLPGGTGAAEGSFFAFFSIFFTESTIKSAVLLWRIMTYFLTILISAPFSGTYTDHD